MNKFEYWFLDVAIEMSIGICWIVPDIRGNLAINKRPLPLSLLEMAEVLHKLFQKGYLLASHSCEETSVGFTPNKSEIREALELASQPIVDDFGEKYFNSFSFFVTKAGGKSWESVSLPKWSQYILHYSDKNNISTIYGSDKSVIEKIIEVEHLLNFDGDGYHIEPIKSTVKWDTIKPWHPTYWKTLPSGYRVSYQFKTAYCGEYLDVLNQSKEFINLKEELEIWCNDLKKWYTNFYKEREA